MPGPHPKPAHLRQRTNRKAGAISLLQMPERSEIPALPDKDGRDWHPDTVRDWSDWWQSEMSTQWLQADIGGLRMLAVLVDEFHKTGKASILAEIRLQRQCYGLTPLDRSRLQWEVERGESADRRLRERERPAKKVSGDPRALLSAVK